MSLSIDCPSFSLHCGMPSPPAVSDQRFCRRHSDCYKTRLRHPLCRDHRLRQLFPVAHSPPLSMSKIIGCIAVLRSCPISPSRLFGSSLHPVAQSHIASIPLGRCMFFQTHLWSPTSSLTSRDIRNSPQSRSTSQLSSIVSLHRHLLCCSCSFPPGLMKTSSRSQSVPLFRCAAGSRLADSCQKHRSSRYIFSATLCSGSQHLI